MQPSEQPPFFLTPNGEIQKIPASRERLDRSQFLQYPMCSAGGSRLLKEWRLAIHFPNFWLFEKKTIGEKKNNSIPHFCRSTFGDQGPLLSQRSPGPIHNSTAAIQRAIGGYHSTPPSSPSRLKKDFLVPNPLRSSPSADLRPQKFFFEKKKKKLFSMQATSILMRTYKKK